MSEKEQTEALKLLRAFLAAAQANEPPRRELVAQAEKFLRLPAGPESHGARRG